MDISRAFPLVFAFYGAAIAPVSAHAEVFELSGNGNFVQISQPAWRSEAVAIPQEFSQPASQNMPSSIQGPSNVRQHIRVAADRYGISSDLVDAVAWQESRYNPRARSSAGAMGVMQLMPGTARQLGVTNPHDVGQNVAGGAAYLRAQLERFDNNVPFALAAYNAGPGAVMKYGGIPPYRETQNYVRQIMRRLSAMSFQRSVY
jgi:soluble lytic murein transglycosylase-like protein